MNQLLNFKDSLFDLAIKRIKDLEYNPPKELLLALIYIGNKKAFDLLKKIAKKFKKGLIHRDTFWNDNLYLALKALCPNLSAEYDYISDLKHATGEMFQFKES